MKNLLCNITIKKSITLLLFIFISFNLSAQHIQYRDKRKPVPAQSAPAVDKAPVPVPERTVKITPPPLIKEDTVQTLVKSKAAFTMNPRPKKPYVEDQNMCNLMSKPEIAPKLPLIINNVSEKMIALIKERYKGRLYSITGLNMFDPRLKFKLKICDKDNAKFRSEYLDVDGNVVNDPDFDYD